jgi:LemA protein
VPPLVDLVRATAAHERRAIEELTLARTRARDGGGSAADASAPEQALARGLGATLARAEAYPELQAASSFAHLHQQLVELENTLERARRYYNGCVERLNRACGTIPSAWVAAATGFAPFAYFEAEPAVPVDAPAIAPFA